MKIKNLLVIGLIALASCDASKDVLYLQDISSTEFQDIGNYEEVKFKPGDKISIIVSSRDPKMSAIYNLAQVSYRAGQSNMTSYNEKLSGYTIDEQGNIMFPVLGRLHVGGLTRQGVCNLVRDKLISEGQLQDPSVTVEYMNLHYSVLGEVKNPGKYNIDEDKVTIFDALSEAGDLTIYGKRDAVFVIREVEGKRQTYRLDLRSTQGFYDSPAYYIQQNDVVYVQPNPKRARETTVNGNSVLSTSFWISLASLLTSMAVLIFK